MGDSRRKQARESVYDSYGNPNYYHGKSMAEQQGDLYYGGNTTGLYPPTQPMYNPGVPASSPGSSPIPQSGGQLQGNEKDVVFGLLQGRPLTPETFREIQPQLQQHGMNFVWNADGTRPDIILPDGSIIDFATDLGTGNAQLAWQPKPGYRGDPATGELISGSHSGSMGGGRYGTNFPGIPGQTMRDYGDIYGRFSEFADTGGFSPADLQNIRARAVSPIRSVYSSANRELERGRALQGDYAPNIGAARAKLAREQGYATADASTNVEAAIAQMVQQGKLAGMGGMAGIYGTTPGLANTFGQQALQSANLSNNMANSMMANTMAANSQPNMFQEATGYAGNIAGAAAPFLPGGGMWSAGNIGNNNPVVNDPYAPNSPYS